MIDDMRAATPSTDESARRAPKTGRIGVMDWKLEVVVVPVTDVDRAKSFYLDKLGFQLDADTMPTEIGPVNAETEAELGMRGSLQLVVTDLEAAHSELTERGVDVSEIQTLDPRDGGKFMFFADPDGNNWAVQEVRQYVGAPLT
jgi:catechol 2,3-dioxygenase-like lactoylglutathione lyase family enzyme